MEELLVLSRQGEEALFYSEPSAKVQQQMLTDSYLAKQSEPSKTAQFSEYSTEQLTKQSATPVREIDTIYTEELTRASEPVVSNLQATGPIALPQPSYVTTGPVALPPAPITKIVPVDCVDMRPVSTITELRYDADPDSAAAYPVIYPQLTRFCPNMPVNVACLCR